MKLIQTLGYGKIEVREATLEEVYWIEQDDNSRFYVQSSNGLNGYEGEGHSSIELALKYIKKSIKNYYADRCIEAPKGW